MDQTTLLKEQFAGGHKLIARLLARGLDLVAAGWAKPAHRASWRLYLVVPAEEPARQDAYALMNGAVDELEGEWASAFERVEWSSVQIVPPNDSLGKGLLEFARVPRKFATWQPEGMLGDTFVEGAYIYPSAMFAKPAPAPGN
jgi:hypothetical protein